MSWQVPGYRHRMHLGDGAGASVVLAVREESGELVVIKYLTAPSAGVEVVRDEIEQMSILDSELFVRVRDVVEEDGNIAVISAPVSGVTLRAMLRDHGALAPEAALVVYRDTLTGLALAHASGVVHGDYRPENVIVGASGATVMTDAGSYRWTSREVSLGTGVYFAPERWQGSRPGAAADVYAATITLYESLAGEPPYWEESQLLALRHQHEQGDIPQQELTPGLREIVRGGLAKDAGDRYDAAALLELVEVAAAGEYGRDWVRRGRAVLGERVALMAVPFGGAEGISDVVVERETELVELDDYYGVPAARPAAGGFVAAPAEEVVALAGFDEVTAGTGAVEEVDLMEEDDDLTEEEEASVAEIEAMIGIAPSQRRAPDAENVGGAATAAVGAALAAGAHRAEVVDAAREESDGVLTITETVEVVTVIETAGGQAAAGLARVAVVAAQGSGASSAEVADVAIVEDEGFVTVTETVTIITVIQRRRGGLVAGAVLGAGAVAAGAVLVEEGSAGVAATGSAEVEVDGGRVVAPRGADDTAIIPAVVGGAAVGAFVAEDITEVDEEYVEVDQEYVEVDEIDEEVVLAGAAGGFVVEEAAEEVVLARGADDTAIIPAVVGGADGFLVEDVTEIDEEYVEIDEVDEEFVAVVAAAGGLSGEALIEDDEVDEEIVLAGAAAGGLTGAEITDVDQTETAIIPVVVGVDAGATGFDQSETAIIPVAVGAEAGGPANGGATVADQTETAVIPVVVGAAAGGLIGEEEGGALPGGVRRHHPGGGTAAAGGLAAGGAGGVTGTRLTDRGRGWVRRHPWFSGFIVLIIIAGCIFGGIAVGGGFSDNNAGPTLPSQSPSPTAPQGNVGGSPVPSGVPGSLPNGGPSGGTTGVPSGSPSSGNGGPSTSPSPSASHPGTPTTTPTHTRKPTPTPTTTPSNPCAPPTHHDIPPVNGDAALGLAPALRC